MLGFNKMQDTKIKMHFEKKNFNGKAIEDKMNHYRHELLSINNWYKLFNFYTFRDNRLFCVAGYQ